MEDDKSGAGSAVAVRAVVLLVWVGGVSLGSPLDTSREVSAVGCSAPALPAGAPLPTGRASALAPSAAFDETWGVLKRTPAIRVPLGPRDCAGSLNEVLPWLPVRRPDPIKTNMSLGLGRGDGA